MTVKLSVDGQDGHFKAQSAGLRDLQNHGQLQRYEGIDRDGRPGVNAPRSIRGAAAGHLSVQLVESTVVHGGICVNVLAYEGSQQLPSSVEVPAGQDLLLTAIGGKGEDGMDGEDGQSGRVGVDGVEASQSSDATAGTNGGNGGDAGTGGDGADGGNGGTIEVTVHEDQMHLLMALKWDVRGGEGGQPGQHGQPGSGGMGGKGGKEYTWEARIGYSYSCTDRCIGNDTTEKSSSLVRVTSKADRLGNQMLARIGSQVVSGGDMTRMMAEAATRFHALRTPSYSGVCKCHGGSGHCTGCDSKPLMRKFKRVQGLDGEHGHSGAPGTSILRNGVDGRLGKVALIVQRSDGRLQEYSSLYRLELTDFDVEDENGDGVFEPGEYFFIRRITVRNSGGMPSPARHVQLDMVESEWFKMVDGHEGRTFLPSIMEGSSVTIDSSIKVRIREPVQQELPTTGALFTHHDTIAISALMTWVDREIPAFDFGREIEIRYPCELRNIRALPTVAQASVSRLSYEVYNHGNLSIGPQGQDSRVVEIDVSFPEAFGGFEMESGQCEDSIVNAPANIRGRKGLLMEQRLRIHNNAQVYQHVAAVLKLYLGKPHSGEDISLVHVVEVTMQVSDLYHYNPDASFLLVTNSGTGRERVQSIRRFINTSLRLDVDTWNVSLSGNFDHQDDGSEPVNVLSKYYGKTVIFLANQFRLFEQDTRSIFDICDTEGMAAAAANDTNFLFLDTPDFGLHKDLMNEIAFHSTQAINPSHRFNSITDLATAITQEKQHSSLCYSTYAIAAPRKWYRMASVKEVTREIQQKLPTDRIIVTKNEPTSIAGCVSDFETYLNVTIGVPYHSSMAALEPTSGRTSDKANGMPTAEAYQIVNSLSFHHRAEILWTPAEGLSQFAIKAVTVSLIQATHRELELLLDSPPWPDKLLPASPSKQSLEQLKFTLTALLPALHAVLFHRQGSVNENVLSVLRYSLATTLPQSKRQLAAQTITPTHHRRQRTHAFLEAVITRVMKEKGLTQAQTEELLSSAKKLHTSESMNTGKAIVKRVADLTNQSEYAVVNGRQDITDALRHALHHQ